MRKYRLSRRQKRELESNREVDVFLPHPRHAPENYIDYARQLLPSVPPHYFRGAEDGHVSVSFQHSVSTEIQRYLGAFVADDKIADCEEYRPVLQVRVIRARLCQRPSGPPCRDAASWPGAFEGEEMSDDRD